MIKGPTQDLAVRHMFCNIIRHALVQLRTPHTISSQAMLG